jgi:hypothetical protein
MKRYFYTILFAMAATALLSSIAAAQNLTRALPFETGETLTYEAKVSKFISGMDVADVTFTVGEMKQPGILEISADARSKGTLLKLARYSFIYQFISNIDTSTWRIQSTERVTAEKERQRTGEAKFDYQEKQVTYVETDPANPMRPPRKIASGIDENTQDVVSGIYSLRMMPLAVGKKFEVTVSDTGLVYQVPVRVTAREQQKTVLGKVWCFRVEPDVFGPGKMIEDKGAMTIWITDDTKRIPVRSRIDTKYGRVEVRLKSMSNSKLTAQTK